MIADNYSIGTKFKNIYTNDIWFVVDFVDEIVFENGTNGDISEYLYEDNFEEITK